MDVPVEWDICVEMDVSADDGGMSLVSWLKAKRHDDWKITKFQKHVFISAEQVDNLTFEHVPWGGCFYKCIHATPVVSFF